MHESIVKLKACVHIEEFDSSNKNQTYILTCEGKRWQITEYLYALIKLIDGKRSIMQIALLLSECLGREVGEKEIQNIAEGFLAKRGILEGTFDSVIKKNNSYMWLKIPLIKSKIVQKLSFLNILFNKELAVPLTLAGISVFIYAAVKYAKNVEDIVSLISTVNRVDSLYPLIFLFVSSLFHEFGHASACMHYGQKPGDIGFALYLAYPVFFADASGAWQLKRFQRAVVDIGGVYFQFIFFTQTCLIGIITSNNTLIFSSMLGVALFLGTINPFIKMDGYWMVTDLLGIPNLHDTTKKYISMQIRHMFGMKNLTEGIFIKDINKKEKILFYVYIVGTTIFMVFFISGLAKIGILTVLKLYCVFSSMRASGMMSLENIVNGIYNNISLVVTAALLVKIIFTTAKGILAATISLVNDLKKLRALKLP